MKRDTSRISSELDTSSSESDTNENSGNNQRTTTPTNRDTNKSQYAHLITSSFPACSKISSVVPISNVSQSPYLTCIVVVAFLCVICLIVFSGVFCCCTNCYLSKKQITSSSISSSASNDLTGKFDEIVFVCRGNTCRSFMAEYLFKDLMTSKYTKVDSKSAATDFIVSSRGMEFFPGKGYQEDPTQSAVDALADYPITSEILEKSKKHKARPFDNLGGTGQTLNDVRKRLYVCMQQKQVDQIRQNLSNKGLPQPEVDHFMQSNVKLLLGDSDLPDPMRFFNHPKNIRDEEYRKTLNKIANAQLIKDLLIGNGYREL